MTKLIEVALPVESISRASRADKARKTGTIKNIHKWFAPMPTPAMRALVVATLLDDPGNLQGRAKLLDLIARLTPPDGGPPPRSALEEAASLIRSQWPELPSILDPFVGGGATLVESQRLGLPAVGGDLNPVAGLIARTLVDVLPNVADTTPLNPTTQQVTWSHYGGIRDDVRHYSSLIGERVRSSVGHHYQGQPDGTTVAWLWTRTIPCVSPPCGLLIPLYGSPWLSKMRGREAFLIPSVGSGKVSFRIGKGLGPPPPATKIDGRARFRCPSCGTIVGENDIRAAGMRGRLSLQPLAVCVDTPAGRTFQEYEQTPADTITPAVDIDEIEIGKNTRNFNTPLYGLTHHHQLYTPRQSAMLATFADEIAVIGKSIESDGGTPEQVRAVTTLLGLALGRLAQANSSLVRWRLRDGPPKAEPAFGTQAMPMLWDFAEANPFGSSVGSWKQAVEGMLTALKALPTGVDPGRVVAEDARVAGRLVAPGTSVVVTDPPYFAQINYSELSDYFYPWLRRALRDVHPDLFATIATPKDAELVANPVRHNNNNEQARNHFISGFTEAFSSLKSASHPSVPIVIVYAHKQEGHRDSGIFSTAWESLLEAVLAAGLGVVATWPIEATAPNRQISQGANSLASYIVMVCRSRNAELTPVRRPDFVRELRDALAPAIRELQLAALPAIDLRQAAIGPGMEVFSRFSSVIETDGNSMSIAACLTCINEELDRILSQQEGDFDADTRFCIQWFRDFGFENAHSGRADDLARSTNTLLSRLERGGVFYARAGVARLLSPEEHPDDYDPTSDLQISVWELCLHLARSLQGQGMSAASSLMRSGALRVDLEAVRELAYLLTTISVEKGLTKTAALFNGLVTSWNDLQGTGGTTGRQGEISFDVVKS